jgi:chemotaxis protein MotB
MRKSHQEEPENHERWLVSYADFITLLFAFFVVLYATSSQNEEKEKKFENSIRASFKMIGGLGDKMNNSGGPSGNIIDPEDVLQRKRVGNEELEVVIDRMLAKNLSAAERKDSLNGVRHEPGGVRIILSANSLFPTGSAKLRLPALKSIDKIAAILKLSNRSFVIEGHTDDQPSGGNYDSNWDLASIRATSILKYLVRVHKMDPSRLSAASYADQRPLAPNTTAENRSKNRRIEILIVNRGDE